MGGCYGDFHYRGEKAHIGDFDFWLSSSSAIFTQETYEKNEKLHIVLSDPGFYMMMVRNVLFYQDGLHAASRYVRGYEDEEDKFDYSNLDLSRLHLPDELPLEGLSKRLKGFDRDSTENTTKALGRPGGKNGEPIATLTIRLMNLPENQLSRYTAEAAGLELQQIFALKGLPGRNVENCKKDAAGILRAVRAARERVD